MRMKIISPIITSLLLVIIAASVASVLYFSIISMVDFNESSIEIIDAKLIKQYGNLYAYIVLYNSGETSVKVKMILHGESNNFSSEYTVIAPRDTSRINIIGTYGYDFIVGEDYVIEIAGDVSASIIVKCSGLELTNSPIYIFAPSMLTLDLLQKPHSKEGSIENVSEVVNGILETARKLGIVVKTITSLDEWLELVLNPKDNVIVINPFGEFIPIPQEYFNDTEKMLEFITMLHNNIRDHGWVWVHLSGYPLYYGISDSDYETIRNEGFEYLLFGSENMSVVSSGGSVQDYVQESEEDNTSRTVEFKSWLKTYGFSDLSTKLANRMKFHHSIVLSTGVEDMVALRFYTNPGGSQSGACVLRIGKGLYVHWGSPTDPQFSDKELGTLGLLLTIYSIIYLR